MYRTKRSKPRGKKRFFILCLTALMAIIVGFSFLLAYISSYKFGTGPINAASPSPGTSGIAPTATPSSAADASAIPKENLPSAFGFKYELMRGNKIIDNFNAETDLAFGKPEEYSQVAGVTGFRGNNYRNSPSYGYAEVKEQKLEKVWFAKTGYIDGWTGVGWTGQPSIIKWDESVRKVMNIQSDKKQKKDLKEIIYATLDGKIYFLDLEDGKPTRNPIDTGFPHKGSVAVDPRGYPLLYAGQGINSNGSKYGDIGHRIFSLIDQKLLYFLNGIDSFAYRQWGAFDGNPLINKATDTLLLNGENGLFYNIKLNTRFDPSKGTVSVSPDIVKMRHRNTRSGTQGSENSVAVYKNYAYFADNSGILYCMDTNTMKPVWMRSVTDDTDSTVVIDEVSSSEVYLYTGCEVDIQGVGGSSYVRKINALTGELVWEKSYPCVLNKDVSGGVLATPVVGKNEIKDMVIFNIAKTKDTPNSMGGKLVAYDKKTGKEIWTMTLQNYGWSSPVDIYTKEGKAYIILCDSLGNMMLIDPLKGTVLNKINLEANIEGSPAVYDNMIVVGTRGQKIWGIRIK